MVDGTDTKTSLWLLDATCVFEVVLRGALDKRGGTEPVSEVGNRPHPRRPGFPSLGAEMLNTSFPENRPTSSVYLPQGIFWIRTLGHKYMVVFFLF